MFMVLMDFGVCSKRGATVVFVIKAVAKDSFPWTPLRRDAHGRRKVVEVPASFEEVLGREVCI
jgi:hypothetical protein